MEGKSRQEQVRAVGWVRTRKVEWGGGVVMHKRKRKHTHTGWFHSLSNDRALVFEINVIDVKKRCFGVHCSRTIDQKGRKKERKKRSRERRSRERRSRERMRGKGYQAQVRTEEK